MVEAVLPRTFPGRPQSLLLWAEAVGARVGTSRRGLGRTVQAEGLVSAKAPRHVGEAAKRAVWGHLGGSVG